MAYQIDFTASNYAGRSRRKAFLRLLLLAAIAGAAWGVYDVYTTYNQPTLNMRLAEYETIARPVEAMNRAWDAAAREYSALTRYYRLVWAANPTNFLNAMASQDASRLGRAFKPLNWTLKTGGGCRLEYLYVFNPGDKAEQARGIAAEVVNAVTSVVQIAANTKVDVQGVQQENLLNVDELNVTARFALPDVRSFPPKERVLADCVNDIVAMRKKVQESKIADKTDVKSAPTTARGIMMAYLSIGKDKPDFPDFSDVINVSGWFDSADKFIAKNRIPGDDDERHRLEAAWNKVGDARYPWHRFRTLDNEGLVNGTKALESVSDGVRRFKDFLEKRHVDYVKKIEPFIEAYNHSDVFNKPFIETDLKDRAAKGAGILHARVLFSDVRDAEPVVLEKVDEKFTFTWVRWTLLIGDGLDRDGERRQADGEAVSDGPLALEKLAQCARRVLELGPGYALDTIRVGFDGEGNVSGAVLDGILPVKRSESKKEASGNVN